ncbi:hypothetical protein P7K49_032535 [Saguinus oedipus]|uniref:Uncharacterized protein n=1 Tax=Saguinus oedipus TaxID=9490 RepID=A0ABQ9TYI5_SAGOE|nr:hypothetical protein P7K49_032535 [Saguinus oedipus]
MSFAFSSNFFNQIQSAITGTISPQGIVVPASALQQGNVAMATVAGGTVYQPVTVVTPQGQVVTQTLSPGTIRIQNSQVCVPFSGRLWGRVLPTWGTGTASTSPSVCLKSLCLV